MGKPEIVIVGLGPGGSLLAWKAAGKGYRVRAYDFQKTYIKPCGDAIIIREEYDDILRRSGSISGTVKRHIVEVPGYGVKTIEHERPAWYIVDKTRLVGFLREAAEAEGAEIRIRHADPLREKGWVRVDARGPYAHPRRDTYIITYRVLARVDSWDQDTALLRFETRRAGLAWIFPSHMGDGIVNAGGGLKGSSLAEVKSYVKRILGERFNGKVRIIDERAAPIAVYSRVEPAGDGVIRLGEAAGLINSAGGEGIRMALLSALLASRSLDSADPVREYSRLVAPLAGEARLTRRLLRAIENLEPERGARLLYMLPDSFWRGFIAEGASIRLLLKTFSAEPGVGLEALRALLSSRS